MADDILPIAERLDLPRETLELLITRGAALVNVGRLRESIVTLVGAVAASSSYGLVVSGIRARVNLSYAAAAEDPRLAFDTAREGVEILHHLGMRDWPYMVGNAAELAIRIGDWEWALSEVADADDTETDAAARMRRAEIHGLRGMDVNDELQRMADRVAEVTELQTHATVDEVRAAVALARGDARGALELTRKWYLRGAGPDSWGPIVATRAAAWLEDAVAAREVLGALEGQRGRVAEAGRRECESVLAILEDRREEGIAGFIEAIRRWRDVGLEFDAAMCALSLVSLVGATDPEVRAAGEWAAALFERVDAGPFARRLADAMEAAAAAPATPPRNEARVTDAEASSVRSE